MFGRQKVSMLFSEFLGATMLGLTMLAMVGRTTFPFFSGLTAAVVLLLMIVAFGAYCNPVITLGLWTMRKIQTTQAIAYITVQMLGGLVALRLSEYIVTTPLRDLSVEGFDLKVLIAEAIGTAIIGMGVALAVHRAHTGLSWASVVVAAVFIGMIIAGFTSYGLLNPSVALALNAWNWAYIVGPILGGMIGISIYGLVYVGLPANQQRTKKSKVSVKTTVKKNTKAKKTSRSKK